MAKVEVEVRDKILLTLDETAAITNIGIGRIREVTQDPRCPFVIHIGERRLVKRKKLEEYIDKNLEF